MSRTLPVAALLALMTAPLSIAGSLTPPGPPAPTMKALDVAEPRTPISSLPFTIDTSGSYYLTGSLTMSGIGDGITVTAERVTIDLNGFTLDGNGAGQYAIVDTANLSLEIRGGTLANWTVAVVAYSTPVVLDRLTVRGSLGVGANVGDATVKHCLFLFNGGAGLWVNGVGIVTDSRAGGNGGWGMLLTGPRSLVSNCIIDGNGYALPQGGLRIGVAGTIRGSSICNNTGPGISADARALIAENNVFVNSGDGVLIDGESRVESNHLTGNGGYGVHANSAYNTVIKNSARSNFIGNYDIPGTPNVATFDATGLSTNPWVNFSF